jgi:pSer/pThr/pTyr-binding forkhead associated (FHA) protein
MREGRITIAEPNGVTRTRPITPQGLIIGRGADSDLVINYASASRHHAQVGLDGANYYVMDLGSTNGTYLDGIRLAANQPTIWPPGSPLTIGNITFQLEQLQFDPQQPLTTSGGGDKAIRDQDRTDTTMLGWQSGDEQKPSPAATYAAIGLVVLFSLCLLGAVGGALYYYFS